MRIYLVGFMGSGKSFAGKQLAQILDYQFVDLDDYIEDKECATISDIFENRGEQAFRQLESHYLKDFDTVDNIVVATGGGTPCNDINIKHILANGESIYMQANAELLYSRLKNQKENRPLIAEKSKGELLGFISQKLEEREPYYTQATFTQFQTQDDDDIGEKLKARLFESL